MNNNLPYAAQASTIPPYNGTSSLHPQSLKSLEQSENPRSRNDMRRESTALCWRRCGTRYVLGQSGISTFLRSEGTSLRSYAAAFAASAAAAFISIHPSTMELSPHSLPRSPAPSHTSLIIITPHIAASSISKSISHFRCEDFLIIIHLG